MISKTGIHALAALTKLATLTNGDYAGASDIADDIGAPRNYLGKLLKTLASNGLLVSQKGFNGGFRLAKDADDISLFDVIEPIDKVSRWGNCFMRSGSCSEESLAPSIADGRSSGKNTLDFFTKRPSLIWHRRR
ncbi:MAG: Rrf2 family transcriptional regulator [bacterium]|nr:Rrf2 family transcriptional regulator [bacterium]